jgi:hypothetical protein
MTTKEHRDTPCTCACYHAEGDLDDDPNEGHSDMDEWFPQDESNDRD